MKSNLTEKDIEIARQNKSKVQVFTPPELIDFVENSVNHILKEEFNLDEGINSQDIEIIDPAAGEANFTARGLDTGLINTSTASRIKHYEILPESAEIAKDELLKRGVKNPQVYNTDVLRIDPFSGRRGAPDTTIPVEQSSGLKEFM